MITPRFESIGAYVPEAIVSTKEILSRLHLLTVFDLESITGIKNRRWRAESENSFYLACRAARECLRNSRYKPEDLDIIIYTAITRSIDGLTHRYEPTISNSLKNELGARKAMDFDVTNACAGMMTGAYILYNMIKAGEVQNGMVVSGECITPIAETALLEIGEGIDPQFASLTVGDAGAAFILDKSPDPSKEGIDFIEIAAVADYADLCFGMPSEQNPGIQMITKAIEIHAESIKRGSEILDEALKKHGMTIAEIDYFVPHQTSTRAIKSLIKEEAKYFSADVAELTSKYLVKVDEYGNTASTTHTLLMYNMLKENNLHPGKRYLYQVFASGLLFGTLSFKIGNLRI